MRFSRLAPLLILTSLALFACGCPKNTVTRTYADPTVDQILEHLAEVRAAGTSFSTDSEMDYWVGKDRFRGTVYVMGTEGARVRLNALKPDGSVAADLACDGTNFVYVDYLNNCYATGPCNKDTIAQMLRVPMAPDDFLYLTLGATPVIDGAAGKVTWDSKRGREVVELAGDGGMQQTIELDGKGQRWDVLKSELRGADGVVIWTVENTKFLDVTDEAGVVHRVPGKTTFKTPQEKSDLLVDWGEDRQINLELAPSKFELIPPPIPMCGSQPPATP